MTKTDLERLHKVVSGEWTHRGCGKTFAHCHDMAAAIVAEGPRMLIGLVKCFNRTAHIIPTLQQVFDEYEIQFIRRRGWDIWVKNKEGVDRCIRFMTYEQWDRGLSEGIDAVLINFKDFYY